MASCVVVSWRLPMGYLCLDGKDAIDRSINAVPLTVVVDAKDTYDKASSDPSSFGSQKSLAFTVAWLRAVLRRPNPSFWWTATANMFCDAGTKRTDVSHLRETLGRGVWSITYSPNFVKQVSKGKRAAKPFVVTTAEFPDEPLDGSAPMLGFLMKLAGWHGHKGIGINITHVAKSYRTPEPRFSSAVYPLPSVALNVLLEKSAGRL